MHLRLLCAFVVSTYTLIGCSSSSDSDAPSGSPSDASADVSSDAPADVFPPDGGDAAQDASLEAASEVGPDATTDTAPEAAVPDAEVYAHTDLPRIPDTQGLSATAFDPATRTLYALRDEVATIVPLVANEDYTEFTPGTPLSLTGRPFSAWDGEGLILLDQTFVAVTVETNPTVERFGLDGTYVETLAFPSIYEDQRAGNKGNESLTVAPSGQFLFAANEQALLCDGNGPTKSSGSIVRIARLDSQTLQGPQYAWMTEPLGEGTGGDMGVTELAALDDDTLLVLERGFQSDYGNTVRIFKTSLQGATDVSAMPNLDSSAPMLDKELLVDLVDLPSTGFTHPSAQANPILDNYEALSVGPLLPDGRRLLFVTSDDNGNVSQVSRVLVLALRGI